MDAVAPQVTVAVVVRDRRAAMLRCLRAILAQEGPPFEVLVIDNGSTDGTPDAVRAVGDPRVRVEVVPGTLGAIRGHAVAAARGQLLLFADSDTEPQPGWLRTAVEWFAGDPWLGVLQGRTVPEPGVAAGRWPETLRIERESLLFECANLGYRTEAIRAARGFDPRDGFFGEDTSAGWSVVEAGWGHDFAHAMLSHHEVRPAGLRAHARRAWRGFGNFPRLVRRHPAMRDRVLWRRCFLRPRSAGFAGLALGAILALLARRPAPLLLGVPYVVRRVVLRPPGEDARTAAELVALDAVMLAATLRGSIRERTLVI